MLMVVLGKARDGGELHEDVSGPERQWTMTGRLTGLPVRQLICGCLGGSTAKKRVPHLILTTNITTVFCS